MNKYTFYFIFKVLCLCVVLTGCSKSEEEVEPTPQPNEEITQIELKERKDITLNPNQKSDVIWQNDLGLRIFNIDVSSNTSNSLISPLSITQCLSLAANGAGEQVAEEILSNVLHDGGNLNDLNTLNKFLVTALTEVDNSSILTFSNSVWVNQKYDLIPTFTSVIKDYYNAECFSLNMYAQEGANKINSWINSTTNGLIPKLFDHAPGTEIAIINTMYFKGIWSTPFEETLTKKNLFNNENGKPTEVDFMNAPHSMRMATVNSDYTVVKLSYGNKAFSFYCLMPKEGVELSLTQEKWNKIKGAMSYKMASIALPKFEVSYTVPEMEEKMKRAGFSKLFTSGEAFSNCLSPNVNEIDVAMCHKTVFKVNEQGAEGAGMTEMGPITCGPDEEGIESLNIVYNRPFIYIVEEQSTGAILFIGTVRNL